MFTTLWFPLTLSQSISNPTMISIWRETRSSSLQIRDVHWTHSVPDPLGQSWWVRGREGGEMRRSVSLLSKHLWDQITSLMCRSLGYWLPPQPKHFSMRALTSLLCPPILLPSLHAPHPSSFPSSASLCSPSLQPLQSVLYPCVPRYPPTPVLPSFLLPSSPPFSV